MLQDIITSMKHVLKSSIYSVTPECLFNNELKIINGEFCIKNYKWEVNKNVYVVGFGKAVYGMAYEIEKILNSHIKKGIISVPVGVTNVYDSKKRLKKNSAISVIEGARNNLPDKDSFFASIEIYKLVNSLTENDVLIVLISGGGSSLLPYPIPPITIEEKIKVIKHLVAAGADITELNIVRKKLSCLKGGKLAVLAYPVPVISLIISDVIGNPIEFIASGPTVPDNENADTALKIINKYNLFGMISDNIKQVLRTAKSVNKSEFEHVHNIIIGNNDIALHTAKNESENFGYKSIILSNRIEGTVIDVVQFYIHLIVSICKYLLHLYSDEEFSLRIREFNLDVKKPYLKDVSNVIKNLYVLKSIECNQFCLISGGEPTVKVNGDGVGGRNQELALYMAIGLNNLKLIYNWIRDKFEIVFLSAGTDGIDGPSDAAGAISYIQTVDHAMQDGIDPVNYLINNDSHNFYSKFKDGNDLIRTGHTGTNVMDLHLIFIKIK